MLLAFGVRWHAIDRFATGYDELFTVLEANGHHREVIQEGRPFTNAQLKALDSPEGAIRACISTDGGNGVLYILSMHVWTDWFGNGNAAIRSFSLCWGLVVVWLMHHLALRLFSDRLLALIVALFAALAPLLVDFSQEARAYMPATAISLLATSRFVLMMRESRSPLSSMILYGLLIGAGLLMHYSTIYVALGHALFAVITLPGRIWRRWYMVAAPIVMAVLGGWLLLGGWEGLGNMGRQNERYTTMIAAVPDYSILYRKATVVHLVQDALVQFLWLGGNSLFPIAGLPLRVMALLLIFPLLLLLGLRGAQPGQRRELVMLAALASSGTVFTIFTSALAGHTFGMRYYYVMFSAPYAIILLAKGGLQWLRHAVGWKRLTGQALLLLNVCVFVLSILSFYRHGYRGFSSPERLQPFANAITALAEHLPDVNLRLVHCNRRDASALNLHLGTAADQVPQIVDPGSPYQTIVLGHIDSTERELLVLH